MKFADGTEWVLVPRVATEEMIAAGEDDFDHGCDEWKAATCYDAFLAAAPQPPVEEMASEIAEMISVAQVLGNVDIRSLARAIVKRLIGD